MISSALAAAVTLSGQLIREEHRSPFKYMNLSRLPSVTGVRYYDFEPEALFFGNNYLYGKDVESTNAVVTGKSLGKLPRFIFGGDHTGKVLFTGPFGRGEKKDMVLTGLVDQVGFFTGHNGLKAMGWSRSEPLLILGKAHLEAQTQDNGRTLQLLGGFCLMGRVRFESGYLYTIFAPDYQWFVGRSVKQVGSSKNFVFHEYPVDLEKPTAGDLYVFWSRKQYKESDLRITLWGPVWTPEQRFLFLALARAQSNFLQRKGAWVDVSISPSAFAPSASQDKVMP